MALPRLEVTGNVLIQRTKRKPRFQIRGVNKQGTDYACIQGWGIWDGPNGQAHIDAMKSWRVNTVRVLLNEHCWLGCTDVKPEYSGETYRSQIIDYVNRLNSNGLYAIVDLHNAAPNTPVNGSPMPNQDNSLNFWRSVATTFGGYPGVIFDLYNEPYPDLWRDTHIAWECWQHGGDACDPTTVPYEAVGMQSLVDVVRSTGAPNVLILSGVTWANGFSEFLTHIPYDPMNNLMAGWHIYPDVDPLPCNNPTCWQSRVGAVMKEMPVVATEIAACGPNNTGQNFKNILTWLDQNGGHYTAFTWNTMGDQCPQNWPLIIDNDGTPSVAQGSTYRSHLLSK